MGFRSNKAQGTAEVTLQDDGAGYVVVELGSTNVLTFSEDGTLELSEYVDEDEVGNLKLTDGEDDGWGSKNQRARVFFRGEELVLPSELKNDEPKKTNWSKKTDKVLG